MIHIFLYLSLFSFFYSSSVILPLSVSLFLTFYISLSLLYSSFSLFNLFFFFYSVAPSFFPLSVKHHFRSLCISVLNQALTKNCRICVNIRAKTVDYCRNFPKTNPSLGRFCLYFIFWVFILVSVNHDSVV